MYQEEILEFLKDKISQKGYDGVYIYMKSKGKFLGLFKRKFKVKPTFCADGYIITFQGLDYIIVH